MERETGNLTSLAKARSWKGVSTPSHAIPRQEVGEQRVPPNPLRFDPVQTSKNPLIKVREFFGAGNGDRTRGLLLGKETLYH